MIDEEELNKYLEEFTLPTEGPYYTSYYKDILKDYRSPGLAHDSLNWGDVPYLAQVKTDLIAEFNTYYRLREIGGETYERFQFNILHKFIQIKRRYNNMLKAYLDENIDQIGKLTKETYDGTSTGGSTSKVSGNSQNTEKYSETPITALMEQGDYETTRRTNEGTTGSETESSDTDTSKYTRDIVRFDGSVIKYLNEYSDEWRDIEMNFIKEFDVCFFNVMGKV